jgi:ribosomal-protein-alanine N-acetyltransferase
MPRRPSKPCLVVSRLEPADLVGLARCFALDAEVFPYASIPLGLVAERCIWIAGAEDDTKRLLGFVAASARRPSLYVHGLAVAPAERRQGAGRALVRACVAGARASRLKGVVLHVGTANEAAVAMYASEGFTIQSRLPRFYREGVYAERSAYQMILPL